MASAKLAAAILVALIAGAAAGFAGDAYSRNSSTSTSTTTQTITTTTTLLSTFVSTSVLTEASTFSPAVNASVRAAVGTNSSIALTNSAWDGGYLWELTGIDNVSVVRLVGNWTYTPSSGGGLVGGPANTQVFSFEALKAGNANVTLQLVRPWERTAPIAKYVIFFVVT